MAGPGERGLPAGAEYSFQYMDTNRDTLLRYDNSPYHVDIGRHRRHTSDGDIEKLEFTGLSDLIEDFQNEVNEIYEQRTD